MEGLNNGTPLFVAAYPVAWRIGVVDDDGYRGFEYIRWELHVTQHAGADR